MRGPNKMPHGNKPSKRGLKANYIFPVTANVDLDDYKWLKEQAKKLNVSVAEVIRRCIRGEKLMIFILDRKDEENGNV